MKHYHAVRLKHGIKFNAPFRERIFHCLDPECFWYNKAGNLLGKKLQCPACRELYIADRDALMKKLPHCKACTKGTKVQETMVANERIEDKLKELFGLTSDD